MNCNEARAALHASVLHAAALDSDAHAHLQGCVDCTNAHTDLQIDQQLRTMVIPAPRDGFVDTVIATAARVGAARRQRNFAMAAAVAAVTIASLALLVGTGTFGSGPIVTLAAHQGKTVRIVIDSPTEQLDATLRIELADNLELAGYPNDRRIEWQTRLSEGKNLLALPLVLTNTAASRFDVTLLHGETRSVVHVRVRPTAERSALPTKA